MFGRRERERERASQAAAEAGRFLDEVLDHELTPHSHPTDQGRFGTVQVVEHL
jgi:hypothetical protein